MPIEDKLKYLNTKKDPENIEEFIEQMVSEKNYNPRDTSFRLITSRRPESSHYAFEFPGKYVKTIKTTVYAESGRVLEMDYAEIINPDENIKVKSNQNIEQQSELPDNDKLDSILYYAVDMTYKTNLPSLSSIITHKNPGVLIKDYIINGHIIRIRFIYVSPEKISKKLNTLENIISNNKEISEEEALYFAYIAIFVDEDAKKIMEKVSELFKQVPYLEFELKHELHQVLKKMIKYHFIDDLNKTRELLYMITETLTQEEFQALSSYDKAIYEIGVLEKRNNEIQKQFHKEIQQLHNEVQQKDKIIQELEEKLEKQG